MRPVLIGITVVFALLALLQVNDPDAGLWVSVYAVGAVAAGLTQLGNLPRNAHRLLAIGTMLLMFFYFFGFFQLAPGLHSGWMNSEKGLEALGLLFSAFAMIPVLSCYSCRLKATRAEKDRRAPAVFSAPPAS